MFATILQLILHVILTTMNFCLFKFVVEFAYSYISVLMLHLDTALLSYMVDLSYVHARAIIYLTKNLIMLYWTKVLLRFVAQRACARGRRTKWAVGTRYEIETGDGSSIRVDVEQDDAVSCGTLVSEPFLSLSALFFLH
jgi:hypothetical protein